MSASRSERTAAQGARDDITSRARGLGHNLTWKLGENAATVRHRINAARKALGIETKEDKL
jgi:hypothetical protein